jgi:hypothetical protein
MKYFNWLVDFGNGFWNIFFALKYLLFEFCAIYVLNRYCLELIKLISLS